MSSKYQALPGMDDILPGEVEKWQWLERRARAFFESCGFSEIRTPVVEPTDLFVRSIGETTDIVHKEMYTFEDRGGRSLTLRPEMTACVARAVIEHNLLRNLTHDLRLYYIGPMFRAERPQAGRKRQFHQIGGEIIHDSGVQADFEIIAALYQFLKYTGVEPRLRINDLSRINGPEGEKVKARLREHFEGHRSRLSKDSLYRLERNVLRIFDSKAEEDREAVEAAPWDEIAPPGEHFQELLHRLDEEQIPYELNRRLVRGLDYYTGAVFEIALNGLGAQDAVAGGGRYDRLYSDLGAKNPVPCTGFSIGMERLLIALAQNPGHFERKMGEHTVYFAPLVDDARTLRCLRARALELAELGWTVRQAGSAAAMKAHLKRANQIGARWMVILGEELERGRLVVKDLEQRDQKEISMDELVKYLGGIISL